MNKHILTIIALSIFSSSSFALDCKGHSIQDLLEYDYIYTGKVLSISEDLVEDLVENKMEIISLIKSVPDTNILLAPKNTNKPMLDHTGNYNYTQRLVIKEDLEYLVFGNYNQTPKRQLCDPITEYNPKEQYTKKLIEAAKK
jgi:hypothetical protein